MRFPAVSALTLLALAVPMSFALAPAAAPQPAADIAVSTVTIQNLLTGYSPPVIVVRAGTTVLFQNHDTLGATHTVSSLLDNSFNSGPMEPNEPSAHYYHTFAATGVYAYHCQFHVWMVGAVVAV
jgi:plastocyanin